MNPFSDEYCRKEISDFNCPSFTSGKITIKKVKIEGRCDDFLNVNYRAGITAIEDCPVFLKNNSIWMSLTPMEIQSQYLPILHGKNNEKVATVGLGIGYFTVMIMGASKVKIIDVYEIDQEVIDTFKINFSEREGFSKVNFILGDFRKTFKNKEYDFCYLDPYQDMLPDEILKDYEMLHKENKIKFLRPWGIEKCFEDIQEAPQDIGEFISMNTSKLKETYSDPEYNERILYMLNDKEHFF